MTKLTINVTQEDIDKAIQADTERNMRIDQRFFTVCQYCPIYQATKRVRPDVLRVYTDHITFSNGDIGYLPIEQNITNIPAGNWYMIKPVSFDITVR